MATGGHVPEIDVLVNLQQVKVEDEDEEGSMEEQEEEEEEENLEKTLSVERFGDIISDSTSSSSGRMGRNYTEKDFEYHRHSFHHTHHPLSTHLPLPQRLRKRVHSMDRRRKKKRKKKKTSLPPSDVTPTIHEVDEEEAQSDTDGQGVAATPTEPPDLQPQFSLGSQEDLEEPLPLTTFHVENEHLSTGKAASMEIKAETHNGKIPVVGQNGEEDEEETACSSIPPPSDPSPSSTTHSCFRRRPVHHRMAGAQRSNYDLRERICIGSMTALETAVYQQVPTDEAEAQMLASADLDDMKSHRFEDNPGVRRHLVKKSSRCQISRASNSSTPLSSLKKKKRAADKKTHELFVELNELIVEKDHEMRWKERARWIKFEEDVEEETDRWGKPHVASLSFRSLLELRRTITHGAILLDLEQNSLPGLLVILAFIRASTTENFPRGCQPLEELGEFPPQQSRNSDQVLIQALKKVPGQGHPSDLKHRFHRHQSSASLHGSFNHNHVQDTNLPLVTEEHDENSDGKGPVYDPKQDVFVSLFKSLHPLPPESNPAAARSMKLLAKIPKDAEAVIVLVGCVEFLEQPAMAFVRLNEAVLLESVLEIPVPVRFLFVLLGPSQSNVDYHEIGRSFSTLMSDKSFHEVAYFADDRQDLLNGINEFLDYSIVIPPSEVEGKDLLKTVADFQKQMLRKRKERELKKHQSVLGIELNNKEISPCEEEEEGDQEVDPLKRSGIIFGGLIHDIRRRYPHYVSDLKDALDTQCIAAVIFIYFAALSADYYIWRLVG
ncbi:hypothetical protein fugu_001488 [Takifugu bimaculatus]|uniref:Band 3 cytoplasmic domain-containing protein n=1 Tax=Takifugu bimaculatus TaxID=433685 RepID=A0A4Z2CJP8_9TELE|nr:hypothetical protein fugu_001488 [Takifugu bimaculatus]